MGESRFEWWIAAVAVLLLPSVVCSSFVCMYVAQGPREEVLVLVNGERITERELTRELKVLRFSDPTTERTDDEVLAELVQREILLQEAAREGVAASDTDVAKAIFARPEFRNDGFFDETLYEGHMKSVDRYYYEERLRDVVRVDKLLALQEDKGAFEEALTQRAEIHWVRHDE